MEIHEYHGSYNIGRRSESVRYIVCHYVGSGSNAPGNALANCKYFAGGDRNASAHYFIDDGGIWEYANPSEHYTWHCGDGHGAYGITNRNSIGIEVCIDGDAPYTETEIGYLAELVGYLMDRFGVPAENVVRHYDASRKACPYFYTPYGSGGDGAWQGLWSRITSRREEPMKPTQPESNPVNDAGLYYRAHVEGAGWLPAVRDGQISGTVGAGARMEAFKISPPEGWVLTAKAHIEGIGWVEYPGIRRGEPSGEGSSSADPIIGTVGEARRIEAVEIDVTSRPEGDARSLAFRLHREEAGWTAWTHEGFASGSDGLGKRVEAIQMAIG